MGPGFGADRAPGHLLEVVVANGGCGGKRAGNIVRVHDAALLGRVGPDAGEAIRLQLEVDRERVALAAVLLCQSRLLALDAEQLLDVVAELVRDDVGLSEFAGRPAELLQLIPEARSI